MLFKSKGQKRTKEMNNKGIKGRHGEHTMAGAKANMVEVVDKPS